MANIARMLFVLVLVVAPVVVFATTAGLPPRVASHFGPGGAANGFMPRDAYLALMLALTTVLPVFVVAITGFVPSLALSRLKAGSRDYWLVPERRAETLAWLANGACWMGIALTLFLTATHLLVVRAHATQPPQMPETAFQALLGIFVALTALWVLRMGLRFRKPG